MFTQWLFDNTNNNNKCMTHCSAGIGRTGTTITLAHLQIKIMHQLVSGIPLDEVKFSIFSTVR
jgi:protein tyrosine phosphatase